NGPTHWITIPATTSQLIPVNDDLLAFQRNYHGITLHNFRSSEPSSNYLTQYTVQGIYEDMEKNLWLSTKNFGVFKISNGRFKNYSFDNFGVRNIHQEQNRIFVGTDNDKY
ncbi:MAG: hypothetical protein EOO01_24475, partial [Chitinophagaceae bacterium]